MSEYSFFCGTELPRRAPKGSRVLRAHGKDCNVTLDPLKISGRLVTSISPRLMDLIDIGTYVFTADRITSRGGSVGEDMGREWRRRLAFRIAVRDPAHWSQPELVLLLRDALGFMTEDDFHFDFVKSEDDVPRADYFRFDDDSVGCREMAPVVLFSGGLDSLAGAVDELNSGRRRVVLVSHQSSPIVTHHQNDLVAELLRRYPNRILHLPVRMNLNGLQSRENSQRTRTFLFSCIAGAVAAALSAPGIRFYENGIMSLNLPLSGQVVGTGATRSTHPRTLTEMSLFLEVAVGATCTVDNPFNLKTKSGVFQIFQIRKSLDLIERAFTCTEVRRRGAGGTHCGTCIQCLHRRFAAFAADLTAHDAAGKYSLDLFESPREGKDLTMLVDLVRNARQFEQITSVEQFFGAFPLELSRLGGAAAPGSTEQAVQAMFSLHRRYGVEVVRVLEQGLERYKQQLSKGLMAPTSLLTFVVGEQSAPSQERQQRSRQSESTAGQRITTLTIDSERGCYSLNGLAPIRGKRSVALLAYLAVQHQADSQTKRKPDRFAYTASATLIKALDVNEDALRRCVERLRNRIQSVFAIQVKTAVGRDVFIQSKSWGGYRLNPAVRLVAPER